MIPFAIRTPAIDYWMTDFTDHLFGDCPALSRCRSVHKARHRTFFLLPDPNGDVCGLCTRRGFSALRRAWKALA